MALFGKARSRRLMAQASRAGEPSEALRLAEAALRLDPESEAAQALVAELLLKGADVEAAIARLQAIAQAGARAARVPLGLASLLRRAGRAEEALAVLAEELPASADVTEQLDRLRLRAATLAGQERWDDAVAARRELVAEDAAHTNVEELATALERAGRSDEARALHRALARFRIDDWHAYLRTLPRADAEAEIAALGAEPAVVLALPTTGVLVALPSAELEAELRPLPDAWRAGLRAHVERCSVRPDDARATLSAAADHPVARYERALLEMGHDTIARAAEAFDRLRDEGWRLPGLAYWQAAAHHAAGDDARAAALYRALVQEAPDHGHAWYLLADVLSRLEGRAAQRAAERRAYVATPLLLARVLCSQLDGITTLGARCRSARLADDDPAAVVACAKAGEDARARTLLGRWSEASELDVSTRVSLGRAGVAVGAPEATARLLAPLVDAEDPEGLALDGERLVAAGQPMQAIERLQRATALDPELARAWEILGVLHAQRRELAAAEPAIRRAAALAPELADNHRNLARLRLETQRGAEAVEPAECAVAMLDPDAGTLRTLAQAYVAAGDQPWARLASWAEAYHRERALHRAALGGVWPDGLPGNVPRPPDVFRPTFGRFLRRLEAIAGALG